MSKWDKLITRICNLSSALGVRHEKLGIKRRKEKLKFAKSFIKST